MGVDIDLTKIPNSKAIAIILIAFISLFGPFINIFIFNEPLLKAYNIITLLLICMSIGFPIVVINAMVIILERNALHRQFLWPRVGISSAMISFFPFYGAVMFGYISKKPLTIGTNIPIKTVITYIGRIEEGIFVLFFLIFLIRFIWDKNKENDHPDVIPGQNNILEYNNYKASIEFSAADEVFYGKILNIDDLINFEGTSTKAIKKAFKEAVEDYIETKKQINNTTESPNINTPTPPADPLPPSHPETQSGT